MPGFILGDVIQDANILEVARDDAYELWKHLEQYPQVQEYINEQLKSGAYVDWNGEQLFRWPQLQHCITHELQTLIVTFDPAMLVCVGRMRQCFLDHLFIIILEILRCADRVIY